MSSPAVCCCGGARDTAPGKRADQVRAIIHHCVLPRAVLSLTDAIFAAKFIVLTHELGTHNFSSLSFFAKIFEDISPLVFSSTAKEAASYGRLANARVKVTADGD